MENSALWELSHHSYFCGKWKFELYEQSDGFLSVVPL